MRRQGSNFARAERFGGDRKGYCTGTGQTAFVGPGSYLGAEQKEKLLDVPCSAVLKPNGKFGREESP